jgi:hypothetical protein
VLSWETGSGTEVTDFLLSEKGNQTDRGIHCLLLTILMHGFKQNKLRFSWSQFQEAEFKGMHFK